MLNILNTKQYNTMRTIGSFSASVICGPNGITHKSLAKTAVSFKSMISTTIAKTRVLFRVLLNRTAQQHSHGFDSIPTELSIRIVPIPRQTLKQTSNLNKLINRLLNGERILFNRITSRWCDSALMRRPKVGTAGLSLGLIGFCVKKNGPTLITETDLIENECQQMRGIFNAYRELEFSTTKLVTNELNLENLKIGSLIEKGCNGAVHNASLQTTSTVNPPEIVVKMVFNYSVESNAAAIFRAMSKECVPFAGDFGPENSELNSICDMKTRRKLVSHPNIIEIYGLFAGYMKPCLGALDSYPDALPQRFGGYARNMTLYIVEKRYDMSLKQYLSTYEPSTHCSTIMLTQLLEAVSFLVKCQISHRDLKTDNILLKFNSDDDIPWLVVTDFGSCLTSLNLYLSSDEICRGGNRALMAPEIISAKSGLIARLDYSKADLFAVGSIAYELYNGFNPFYPHPDRQPLLTFSYKDLEIPEPPQSMPHLIKFLVSAILKRNPYERPQAITAVTLCQILLNMNESVLQNIISINSSNNRNKLLLHWFKTLSITSLSKRRTLLNGEVLSDIEFKLRVLFLSQVRMDDLIDAVKFAAKAY